MAVEVVGTPTVVVLVCVAVLILVVVDVELGLSKISPPTPATMPTTAAAATALLHFRALLLETLLLAILSSFESGKRLSTSLTNLVSRVVFKRRT